MGGWIIGKYSQLSPKLGWVGAWAELGNKQNIDAIDQVKKSLRKVEPKFI